jgi:NAD(P)-dependent dehydrogenase (short-subunit alcohol dehydrogenase family)
MYRLEGKVALVTGAGRGIGRAISLRLAEEGADVAAIDLAAADAEAVAADAVKLGRRAVGLACDVTSAEAVEQMVKSVHGQLGSVDVLVNNAGIIAAERQLSRDGHELTFQVNHLAGFLLTLLMLPPLTVNVASIGQRAPDLDDLMLERGYEGYDAYARSKLAQIMFTFELAKRRPDLVVNALHPATLMDTKMVRETFGYSRSTVAEGVEATAALVERDDVTGRYFEGLREARADPLAYDAGARRRLWDASAALTSAPPLAR